MTQNKSPSILVVDDEKDIRALIKGILEDESYQVFEAGSDKDALAAFEAQKIDLVILDIWLEGSVKDGIALLEIFKDKNPLLPALMISGHGTVETAVSAIKKGAYDFIEKPFKSDRLILMVKRALESAQLKQENETLKGSHKKVLPELVGESPAFQKLLSQIQKASEGNSRLLITGEVGVGKEVVARTIHERSAQAENGFVIIDCAQEENFEKMVSSLEGGTINPTIFLNNIFDLTEAYHRLLGDFVRKKTQSRFISSGTILKQDMDINGSLGQGLSDLLFVTRIEMPPLRKRREDILPLARYFLSRYAEEMGAGKLSLTPDVEEKFLTMRWEGNIRQLKNMMEWIVVRMVRLGRGDIGLEDLQPEPLSAQPSSDSLSFDMENFMAIDLRSARELFEKAYLSSQLQYFEGNISRMAEHVGMDRAALHRKLKSLDLSWSEAQNVSQPAAVQNDAVRKRA